MTDRPERPASLSDRIRDRFGKDIESSISLPEDDTPSVMAERLDHLSHRAPAQTRYTLAGELARGGMGAILKVRDEDLQRDLAMKVILGRDEPAQGDQTPSSPASEVDPVVLQRFLDEAQITGQLDHPGVVPVHELGMDADGRVFFTMRLVKGRDLAKILDLVRAEQEGWSRVRALEVVVKVCDTLAYAHSKGVIHRDLKPANIMVGRYGQVYVMDWGLSKVSGMRDHHDLRPSDEALAQSIVSTDRSAEEGTASDVLLTMDGTVMGTPAYLSPEQARGRLEEMGPSADVYSLGAILYHVLTGQMPYVAHGDRVQPQMVLMMVIQGPPKRIQELDDSVPPELVAICEKAMARDIAQRYPSMSELAEDLRAFLENRVVKAYRTGALIEARKWVRRNQPLAAALAAAVLMLVTGLATALFLRQHAVENAEIARESEQEARSQQQLAQANAEIAQRQANLALGSIQFAITDVDGVLQSLPQATELRLASMSRIAGKFAELEVAFTAGGIRGEAIPTMMAIRMKLASVFEELGDAEAARQQLVGLLAIGERRFEVKGRNHSTRNNQAKILMSLARVESKISRDPGRKLELMFEALALARESLSDNNSYAPGEPSRSDKLALVAALEQNIGVVFLNEGDLEQARGRFEEARRAGGEVLEIIRAEPGFAELAARTQDQKTHALQMEHDRSAAALAYVELRLGRTTGALALYQEAIEGRREIVGRYPLDQFPNLSSLHEALAGFAGNYGQALLWLDRLEEAEPLLLESLERSQAIHALGADAEGPRRNLALAHFRLGTLRDRQGDGEQARLEFEECRRLRQDLVDGDGTEKNRKALMLALARVGEIETARGLADQLGEKGTSDGELHIDRARCYAQLLRRSRSGDQQDALRGLALDALQRALDEGYGDPFRVAAEDELRVLRELPRFQEILGALRASASRQAPGDGR